MHHSLIKALYDMYPQDEKSDFHHAYVYMRHLDHFVYHALQSSGWPAKKPDNEIDDELKDLLGAVVQGVAETAASVETSTYHAKVVKLKDAIQLVTQKQETRNQHPDI